MKRKEKYESPFMERTLVELEDGFCAGSADVQNPKDKYAIENQTINTDFDSNNFAEGNWE